MRNNSDYTTDNLLEFGYLKGKLQIITIDLSKQSKLKDP